MRREIASVTLFTVLSQALAFAKLWVVARIFGVGAEYDGYNLALVVPTWLSGVLAALVQTGLFPVRARLAAERGEAAAQDFERAVLTAVIAAAALLTLLLWGSREIWLSLVAANVPPQTFTAVEIVLPFAVCLVLLNVAGDTLGFLLAIRGRYWVAAAAPSANAFFGTALLLAWPEGRLFNLALGTVLGLCLQLAIVGWWAGHHGRPRLASWGVLHRNLRTLKESALLGLWILPGVVFSNALAALPPALLTPYGEGAVSAFSYAYRLHNSAVQLLIMAASPVILTHFAALVVQNNLTLIRRGLQRATFGALSIGGLALLVVAWGGSDLLLWLSGGRFDRLAAERVSLHWTWLTTGLAFTLVGTAYAKFWQAQKRPRLISLVAGASLAVFFMAAHALRPLAGEYAIALALACAALFVAFYGFYDLFHLYCKPADGGRLVHAKK